jgi:hypothetical protein
MRQMTLWEAVSAFRHEKGALDEVFGGATWRGAYLDSYGRFSVAVAENDRALLDSPLPLELTREIAARCRSMKFVYSPSEGLLVAAGPATATRAGREMLTALDVHDRFGGWLIEEVLEFGSARVGSQA